MEIIQSLYKTKQIKPSELTRVFEPCPQILMNVRFSAQKDPMLDAAVILAIQKAETRLKDKGRLLIRKSGTEPLLRVMGECEDETLLATTIDSILVAVKRAV